MQGPAGLPVPSNAMSTTPDDLMLRALIAENGHVRTDLHWLLTAAIEFTNRYDSGALTVVLQDSALMHGRTLIEFTCFQPKSGYFRLVDFLAAGETAGLETVDWSGWRVHEQPDIAPFDEARSGRRMAIRHDLQVEGSHVPAGR